MKHILTLCLVLLLTVLVPGMAQAIDPAAQKAATIRQIMALGGIDDLAQSYGKNMAEQIYQVLKTSRPEIPPEAMTIIRAEVDRQLETDHDKLLGQIAAIFDRSFTAEEIEELYRFYQTEVGRKSLALMPAIMQENMEIGKSWGKEVGPPLKTRLEARFKQNPPASPPQPGGR